MACSRCQELNVVYAVRRPADLRVVMKLIKAHLSSGTIRLDSRRRRGELTSMQPDFWELPEEGPWPDAFAYRFRCRRCRQRFRLAGEGYHGSGGGWEPHSRESVW